MKAISLWQPWASAIAWGLKSFETRSWCTAYHGPLAIHAAKKTPKQVVAITGKAVFNELCDALEQAGADVLSEGLPMGCIVTACVLDGCVKTTASDLFRGCSEEDIENDRMWGDYSPGRFAWRLAHIKVAGFVPIPCRGAQGLWDVTPELEAKVTAQFQPQKNVV